MLYTYISGLPIEVNSNYFDIFFKDEKLCLSQYRVSGFNTEHIQTFRIPAQNIIFFDIAPQNAVPQDNYASMFAGYMWGGLLGALSNSKKEKPSDCIVCTFLSNTNPELVRTVVFSVGDSIPKEVKNFVESTKKELKKLPRSQAVINYYNKIGITNNPDGSITL